MTPVCVECRRVTRRFGSRVVLDQVDWSLRRGVRTGLVGASGAGKTTLLRILAGLDRASSGEVRFNNDSDDKRPRPNFRNRTHSSLAVGMVFQHLGLWPHLTARQHLHFVLTRLGRHERRSRAEQLLDEMQLPRETWDHRPSQLSGGEAQRLALARTLASEPALLLLDEPLGQLDATLRDDLLRLIAALAERRGVTLVYVSHAPGEVMRLCDRMAVLVDGRLAQDGACEEVFGRPVSAAVARASGPVVELPRWLRDQGRLAIHAETLDTLAADDTSWLPRPQQIRLLEAEGENRWQVVDCRPVDAGWQVLIESDGFRLTLPTALPRSVGRELGIAIEAWQPGIQR